MAFLRHQFLLMQGSQKELFMNNKKMVFIGMLTTAAASLAIVFGALSGNTSNPVSVAADPYSLSLEKNSAIQAVLPESENPTHSPIDYELDSYSTIRFSYATKHNDFLVRLNKTSDAEKGYFEKVEASNGISSIYINLNYGNVDIYTGYEYGVFTHKYSVACGVEDGKPKVSVQKTIPVEGNYFRVVNPNSSENALVKAFRIDYGCLPATKVFEQTTLPYGQNATVHNGRGVWYYLNNSGSTIGSNSYSSAGFVSTIATLSSASVVYRYEAVKHDSLSNTFTIGFSISCSQAVHLKRGNNECDLAADEVRSFTASRTISDADDTTIFNVTSTSGNMSNVVVTVTNILIGRTVN